MFIIHLSVGKDEQQKYRADIILTSKGGVGRLHIGREWKNDISSSLEKWKG